MGTEAAARSRAVIADYDAIGARYARVRRPDPRLALEIESALGDVASVVNVGAGTGAYEPSGPRVVPIEPSLVMIRQRPPAAAPPTAGVAEALPLADACVDAAMAVFSIHHWSDQRRGIREMQRVGRRRVVLVTMDVDAFAAHWLVRDYCPAILEAHAAAFPTIGRLRAWMPGADVRAWPVPRDCSDRFMAALWARPEAYLDPDVRAGTSVWHQLPREEADRALGRLESDLRAGRWDERHGALRDRAALDVGVRIVSGDAGGR